RIDTDADGVTCHLGHRLANPDDSEPGVAGAQAASFAAARFARTTGAGPGGGACSSATGAPCAGGLAACVREAFHGNAEFALFQDAATPEQISRLGPHPHRGATQDH